MTWVNLSAAFTYGSQLTSTQMQNLRDNIAAAFAGDSGAPLLQSAAMDSGIVTEAKMAASAINRASTKTTSGSTSGTLSAGNNATINMQDWCFFPCIYASDIVLEVKPQISTNGGTTGRFLIRHPSSGSGTPTYAVYWRYITATDKPFVYMLRDKATGEIKFVWMSSDPPESLWGIDDLPDDYERPILITDANGEKISDDLEEVVVHKYDLEQYRELEKRINASMGKKHCHELLNDDFTFDSDKKLFVKKNLSMI